jgi:hypothetical protein
VQTKQGAGVTGTRITLSNMMRGLAYVAGLSTSVDNEVFKPESEELKISLIILSLVNSKLTERASGTYRRFGRPIVNAATNHHDSMRSLSIYMWTLRYAGLEIFSDSVLEHTLKFLSESCDWFVRFNAIKIDLEFVVNGVSHYHPQDIWERLGSIENDLKKLSSSQNITSYINADIGCLVGLAYLKFSEGMPFECYLNDNCDTEEIVQRSQAISRAEFFLKKASLELNSLSDEILYEILQQTYNDYAGIFKFEKSMVDYSRKELEGELDFANYKLARQQGNLNSAIVFIERASKEFPETSNNYFPSQVFLELLRIVRDGPSDREALSDREQKLYEISMEIRRSTRTIGGFKMQTSLWYCVAHSLFSTNTEEQAKLYETLEAFENLTLVIPQHSKMLTFGVLSISQPSYLPAFVKLLKQFAIETSSPLSSLLLNLN